MPQMMTAITWNWIKAVWSSLTGRENICKLSSTRSCKGSKQLSYYNLVNRPTRRHQSKRLALNLQPSIARHLHALSTQNNQPPPQLYESPRKRRCCYRYNSPLTKSERARHDNRHRSSEGCKNVSNHYRNCCVQHCPRQ
jgi:hypothetical protein